MVYVVERYLPGSTFRTPARALPTRTGGRRRQSDPQRVRYLDSTIVLRDEACFCGVEGPSAEAVAEANREAGLPFDRIVPAVTSIRKEHR